jgi:hypothetical protein
VTFNFTESEPVFLSEFLPFSNPMIRSLGIAEGLTVLVDVCPFSTLIPGLPPPPPQAVSKVATTRLANMRIRFMKYP